MKKSNYNFLIPYNDNKTIIYNPLYGSLGKFDEENLKAYENNTLDEKSLKILYDQKIYIDDDINEIDIINKDRAKGISKTDSKLFRIWTTTGCNANCYYCFEKGITNKTMSLDTAESVVSFIKGQLQPKDRLMIEWFGGEPLMNMKAIEVISESIIEYCKLNDIKYKAYIITNGSLITNEIVYKFKIYNINMAQITLDGYGDDYDNAKNYNNHKKHNFDLVISNIAILLHYNITVVIRLNYSGKNYRTLLALLCYLHKTFKNHKYLKVYVHPLWSSTDNNVKDKFVSDVTLNSNYINLLDVLYNYGYLDMKRLIGIRYKKYQCYARKESTCSILPNGDITKCAETYNQVICNIYEGITDKELYNEWTSKELSPECIDCKYLPLCNDGCKASRYNNMDMCIPTKNITEELIKWYVGKLDSKK